MNQLWNSVSSFGSLLSILSIIMFIMIIWNKMTMKNMILFNSSPSNAIEWMQIIPPSEHSYFEISSSIINKK